MDNKESIRKLYFEDHLSQAEIGRIYGVSRAYVWKIVRDYKPNLGTLSYNYFPNRLNKDCKICNKEAVLIHHIDKNPRNNDRKNLISLCKKCHQIIHAKKQKN